MGRSNQLVKAIDVISDFFGSGTEWAFTERRLNLVILRQRGGWGISSARPTQKIIDFLVEMGLFIKHTLKFGKADFTLYSWRTTDEFTVFSGIKRDGYFCYYTALFLAGLTQQLPRTFYLNHERADTFIYSEDPLTQEAIDRVFAGEQRKSGQVYLLGNKRAVVTNGKYTGGLGVVANLNERQRFYHTDLERTLIDCTIRPAYSGGVAEVLQAFRAARGRLNVGRLYHYLQELDYIYPYRQSIGFYLTRAGYPESDLAQFEGKNEFDFYLTYNIIHKDYDSRWCLYYPRGL